MSTLKVISNSLVRSHFLQLDTDNFNEFYNECIIVNVKKIYIYIYKCPLQNGNHFTESLISKISGMLSLLLWHNFRCPYHLQRLAKPHGNGISNLINAKLYNEIINLFLTPKEV